MNQNQQWLTCPIVGHHDNPIQVICIEKGCKNNRVLCTECLLNKQQGPHKDHKAISIANERKQFLEDKFDIFNRFMEQLDSLQKSINQGINVLKKKLISTLSPPTTLVNLNIEEVNYKIEKSLQLEDIEYASYEILEKCLVDVLEQLKIVNYNFSDGLEKQCYDLLKNNQLQQFIIKIDEVLRKNPQNEMLILAKAQYFNKIGNYKMAYEICERLETLNQNNPWIASEKEYSTRFLERR